MRRTPSQRCARSLQPAGAPVMEATSRFVTLGFARGAPPSARLVRMSPQVRERRQNLDTRTCLDQCQSNHRTSASNLSFLQLGCLGSVHSAPPSGAVALGEIGKGTRRFGRSGRVSERRVRWGTNGIRRERLSLSRVRSFGSLFLPPAERHPRTFFCVSFVNWSSSCR